MGHRLFLGVILKDVVVLVSEWSIDTEQLKGGTEATEVDNPAVSSELWDKI